MQGLADQEGGFRHRIGGAMREDQFGLDEAAHRVADEIEQASRVRRPRLSGTLRRGLRFAARFGALCALAIRIWSSVRRRRRRGRGPRPSCRPLGAFLALPERRAGLQIIHQELRGLERRLAVLEAVSTSTMFSPGVMRPTRWMTVSRSAASAPSPLGMAHDLGFRHAGIMFERQRRDGLAAFAAAADAGEGDHGADIGAALASAPRSRARCRNRPPGCGW